MYQRRPKKFRHRSNGRNQMLHGGSNSASRLRSDSFSNGQPRNSFRQTLSAEKLFEKYSTLAKEALSSGDKTLSENYLQHADHFLRIIDNKNINQNQNKVQADDKLMESDKRVTEGSDVNQHRVIEEKKE